MDKPQADQPQASPFGEAFQREFPELVAAGIRMGSGEAPQSEHWRRAAAIFQQFAEADPRLRTEQEGPAIENALLKAARQAKLEIMAIADGMGTQLDARLGKAWRPHVDEMLRLLRRLRVSVEDENTLVDLMELLYFGVRFSSFSQANQPKTVQ